jgi:hypothetical protein
MIILDILASADKGCPPLLDAPLGAQIFTGLCCKSLMSFSWLHPLFVEKVNDKSLLRAVRYCENDKGQGFSVKNAAVLRHGALVFVSKLSF